MASDPAFEIETTQDAILNHRVSLVQPRHGFRVAVDTPLLASAVTAEPGQSVLDLGCGVGGALLALAARVPELSLAGIEREAALLALACENTKNFQEEGTFHVRSLDLFEGDVRALPERLACAFDHVMMNPPFYEAGRHDLSPSPLKRAADSFAQGDLAAWLVTAALALKGGGCLTLIEHAQQLESLLEILPPSLGALEIKEIKPKADHLPKRLLLRARQGATRGAIVYHTPLVLHEAEGHYTPAADRLLRDAQALDWD